MVKKLNVQQALETRHSVRAFTKQSVDPSIIKKILDYAKYAPSGTNIQPWKVAVVSGENKLQLDQKLMQAFDETGAGKLSYQYYPLEWSEPYRTRRINCGKIMYETLKITREDKAGQIKQWKANYRAFDAPVVLYFFLDPQMQTGSFMDYGMFLQSIMLMAVQEGLATCPQAALAEYPEIVKTHLNRNDDEQLICGIALGFEDKKQAVNQYRTGRLALEEFCEFYD